MKRIILIPAYEPDSILIELINKINKHKFDIVVVDDGSGKNYDSIFNKIERKCKLIRYDTNQGKGHALKVGYQYIRSNYLENYIVVTMDSDGQHTIEDAEKLASYVEEHPNCLVLGKRIRDKKVPLRSKIGNGITRFVYDIVTGLNVYDTQTGLRAFSYQLMDTSINVEGERFEYEMNILLHFAKMRIPIKEIPIKTIYIEKNQKSHFHTLKDSYRIYKEIIKFSISSIISFLIDYIVFLLLFSISKRLVFSNIIARIISASINYYMNRKYVFQDDKDILKSLKSYILLALIILICNTFLLKLLVSLFSIYESIAKVIVEIIMFIMSWLVQKYIIFKKVR